MTATQLADLRARHKREARMTGEIDIRCYKCGELLRIRSDETMMCFNGVHFGSRRIRSVV